MEVAARDLVERGLHAAQRQRRAIGQCGGNAVHLGVELAGRGQAVQVAQRQQLGGRDGLCLQKQALGGGEPRRET